jgi:hypothetical protein
MATHTRSPKAAFEHAIKAGAFGPTRDENHEHETWPCPCPWYGFAGDFMYMYSDNVPAPGHDCFKHVTTRQYVKIARS